MTNKKLNLIIIMMLAGILLSCGNKPESIDIWLIGDSTMAWKKPERAPESGWGEGLKHFVGSNAKVHNHAASGRSTKSFIDEGRWQNVLDSLSANDFVIIQFGHNDEKTKEKLHTVPFGSFQENLKKFIDESRAKRAVPIICSSIVRRHFNTDGRLKDTHGDYIAAARKIASDTKTPYIDMEALSRKLVEELGPQASKDIYNYTGRKQDSTHLSISGAEVVAGLFVKGVKAANLSLGQFFKDNE